MNPDPDTIGCRPPWTRDLTHTDAFETTIRCDDYCAHIPLYSTVPQGNRTACPPVRACRVSRSVSQPNTFCSIRIHRKAAYDGCNAQDSRAVSPTRISRVMPV